MIYTLLFFITGQFIVSLMYKTIMWYIKHQRNIGNEKYLDDEYYNKIRNRINNYFIAVILFLGFSILYFMNKSNDEALILLLVSGISALIALGIFRIRIPYIERGYKNGNIKYLDEEYTNKLIKKLKIVGSIFAIIALIPIFLMRFRIL